MFVEYLLELFLFSVVHQWRATVHVCKYKVRVAKQNYFRTNERLQKEFQASSWYSTTRISLRNSCIISNVFLSYIMKNSSVFKTLTSKLTGIISKQTSTIMCLTNSIPEPQKKNKNKNKKNKKNPRILLQGNLIFLQFIFHITLVSVSINLPAKRNCRHTLQYF